MYNKLRKGQYKLGVVWRYCFCPNCNGRGRKQGHVEYFGNGELFCQVCSCIFKISSIFNKPKDINIINNSKGGVKNA